MEFENVFLRETTPLNAPMGGAIKPTHLNSILCQRSLYASDNIRDSLVC